MFNLKRKHVQVKQVVVYQHSGDSSTMTMWNSSAIPQIDTAHTDDRLTEQPVQRAKNSNLYTVKCFKNLCSL